MPVTHPKWKAERERLEESMTEENSFVSGELSCLEGVGYEQELWDRAYWHAWAHIPQEIMTSSDDMFHDCTSGCARMADAFMAERAKRLHKG